MKIKVVDVETQQGEAGQQLATIDEAEEDYNSSKTLSSSSKEEDEPDQKPPGEEEEQQPPTKQRVQQLHKCEKCGKMLTLKSLRYSHPKYCGKVSEPVETKMKPEPKVRSKPVSEPAPVNEPAPPPVKEKHSMKCERNAMNNGVLLTKKASKNCLPKQFNYFRFFLQTII